MYKEVDPQTIEAKTEQRRHVYHCLKFTIEPIARKMTTT